MRILQQKVIAPNVDHSSSYPRTKLKVQGLPRRDGILSDKFRTCAFNPPKNL